MLRQKEIGVDETYDKYILTTEIAGVRLGSALASPGQDHAHLS